MRRIVAAVMGMFGLMGTSLHPDAAQACGSGPDDLCQTETGAYRIALPDGVDRPAAMVWLHGWGGSANNVMKNTGMVNALAARGMALIAPDGRITSDVYKNKNWSVKDGRRYKRDDVLFMEQVVADAIQRHGIDPDKILMAGFSRGGSMVWDVACARPGLVRAFAPVAGAFWDPMTTACAGPVDLHHTHGWTDRTVPLEGRVLQNGALTQGDVFQSLFTLRATNGCVSRQPETAPISEAKDRWQRRWTDCTSGKQIVLVLHPGGHGIPKGWLASALDWFEALLAKG